MIKDHYIFSTGRLQRKDNTLYFVDAEGNKKSLPIEQTENVHIFGQVDVNSTLFNLLAQYGIRLHFYNYYGYFTGTFCPRAQNVSGYTVVQQSAHYLNREKRLYLARSFLYGGIHHMLRNLRRHKEKTEKMVQTIEAEAAKLEEVGKIPEVMGIEGRIRQEYYQAFNVILKPEFSFEKRTKRPPTDPLNALISFGNSRMYTEILSEMYKTMLDPTVSFLHEPSSKRFSLSLDLAEIFKPLLVDTIIASLTNNRSITLKHFDEVEGIVFLNDEGRKKFLTEWEKKLGTTVQHRTLKRKVSYRYLIRLECYKLIKHFIGDSIYRPLKAWW